MKKLIGIDISHWQKGIDLSEVKKSGYEFVICKAGGHEANVYYTDECFKTFVSKALSVGLKVGAYYYSTAKSEDDAVKEANHFKEILDDFHMCFEFPLFIDYEDSTCLKQGNKCSDYVNKFITVMESSGYLSGCYSSLSFFNNQLSNVNVGEKWVACWGYNKDDYAQHGIHQYSNNASVNGFRVDANKTFIDYSYIVNEKGLNAFPIRNDINNDGKVNSKDVVSLMKKIADDEIEAKYDINNDGKVNSKDVVNLMKELSE